MNGATYMCVYERRGGIIVHVDIIIILSITIIKGITGLDRDQDRANIRKNVAISQLLQICDPTTRRPNLTSMGTKSSGRRLRHEKLTKSIEIPMNIIFSTIKTVFD